MSQVALSEADEAVSKDLLSAELAAFRTELKDELHKMTRRLGGALAACTALLAGIELFA